ncbi:MAG: quinolinate synthase NadA, partial [Comamonas sp.]|nr:quinolinate synthase NadA [Comamonas sp.]
FIVATDQGILHEMRARYPDKEFMAAPTAGTGASCKSCAFCPWMAMNQLDGVEQVLHHGHGAITLEPALMAAARRPLERMLAFAAVRRQRVHSSGALENDMQLFTHFGAA